LDTIARIQADFTAFRKALSDSVKVAELGLETMIEIKAILRLSQSSSLSEEDLKKIDVDGASQQASEMQTKFFKVRKGVEDVSHSRSHYLRIV
jgi:hypothetical protein